VTACKIFGKASTIFHLFVFFFVAPSTKQARQPFHNNNKPSIISLLCLIYHLLSESSKPIPMTVDKDGQISMKPSAETDMDPLTFSNRPLHSSSGCYDGSSSGEDEMSLNSCSHKNSNNIAKPSQIVTPSTSIDFDELQLAGMNISMTSSQSSYSFDSSSEAVASNNHNTMMEEEAQHETGIIFGNLGLPTGFPHAPSQQQRHHRASKRTSSSTHTTVPSSDSDYDVDDAFDLYMHTLKTTAPPSAPAEIAIHPLLRATPSRSSLTRVVTPVDTSAAPEATGAGQKKRRSHHQRRRHHAMAGMEQIGEALMEDFNSGAPLDIGGKITF
jgi:hypothetical protein